VATHPRLGSRRWLVRGARDGRRPAGAPRRGHPRPADRQRAGPHPGGLVPRRHRRGHCWPATHRSSPTCSTCRDRSTCSTTRVSSCRAPLLAPVTWPPGPSPASTWQWCSPSPPRRRRRRWSSGAGVMAAPPMSEGCCSLLSVHGRPDPGPPEPRLCRSDPPAPRSTRRTGGSASGGTPRRRRGARRARRRTVLHSSRCWSTQRWSPRSACCSWWWPGRTRWRVGPPRGEWPGDRIRRLRRRRRLPGDHRLTGEGHTKGPIQAGLGRLSNDLVSPVATTPLQLFHTGSVGATLVGGDLYENGGALGSSS